MAQTPYSYSSALAIAVNAIAGPIIDGNSCVAISIQCAAMGVGGVFTPEWSNDGTNWQPATLISQSGAVVTTISGAGLWTTPTLAEFFRLRCSTAVTSGTTTFALAAMSTAEGLPNAPSPAAAGGNLIGGVALTPSLTPASGTTAFKLLAAASTNATLIKGGAGKVLAGILQNASAAVKYVKIFNKVTAPVPGTDVPIFTVMLAANATIAMSDIIGPAGHTFSAGIGISVVGGQADTDTTVVAAGDVVVNLTYI